MTSCKEQFVRDLVTGASAFLPGPETEKLRALVSQLLAPYEMQEACTALTTDFAHTNEWYLNQFMAIKLIKGLSENTLRRYRTDLTRFFAVVKKPIPNIEPNDIRFFLAVKARDGCGKVTLNNYLLSLRSFFQTLYAEELISRNPTVRVDRVKEGKVEKKPLSDLDIEKLRKHFQTMPREKAVLEMLLSTGCRVSELVSIDIKDLNGDRVVVTGKGDKQRTVYINAAARFAVDEYLETRDDSEPALFVSRRYNSGGHLARLGKGHVEQILRKAGQQLGIEKCHPHRFRRTMATNALRNGMPIEQVSRLLGHDQISTTQIYAKSEDSDIEAAHRKYVR